MKYKDYKPSKWVLAVFKWFCHPDYREEIEGDLLERFNTNVKTYSIAKANRLFLYDVIQLMRPSLSGNIQQLTHTQIMVISKQNKRLTVILMIVSAILLIPFIAMFFTKEVNWTIFDFMAAAVLLGGTGLGIDFILRKVKTPRNRLLLASTLIVFLILLWAELAVGIFGSPIAGS